VQHGVRHSQRSDQRCVKAAIRIGYVGVRKVVASLDMRMTTIKVLNGPQAIAELEAATGLALR
jgi:hypothetical protein